MVGVLVLVHEHMPEAAAVVVQHGGEGLEHVHDHPDQVVEVHGVGLTQSLRVLGVDLGHSLGERV